MDGRTPTRGGRRTRRTSSSFSPTITGAALPEWPIDGRNILPILDGSPGTASSTHAVYFYDGGELVAVRSDHWKLHLPHDYETVVEPGVDGKRGQSALSDLPTSLFDLDAEPGETTNLAEEYPDVVTRLTQAAMEFDADIKRNQRAVGQL